MWHLLISLKFRVYSVLVAHLLTLVYLFPVTMFYLTAHIAACSVIICYISFQVQMDEIMDFYDYELHNEIDLKLKSTGYYLT